MARRPLRTLVLALLAGAALAGCASNAPYTAPQTAPQRMLPRAPVVAPSGPGSPWWWPLPSSWWPVQPW